MVGIVRSGWQAIGLDRSPLLADLGPADRPWWKLPLGAVGGMLAAVLTLSLLFAIVLVGATLVMGPEFLTGLDQQLQGQLITAKGFGADLATVGALALINGAAALILVVVASLIVRKPVKLSFTMAPRWRWRQLLVGLGLGLVMLAPILAFDVWRTGEAPQWSLFTTPQSPLQFVIYPVVIVVCIIAAAGAEELVFRGWLLRHSAATIRYLPLVLALNAILFSAMHGDGDPNAFIDRALAGLAFCYMALRTGGVEFSTGAHAANNLLIVLLIQPLSLDMPPPEAFDPVMTLESLVGFVLTLAIVEVAMRHRTFRAWMDPAPENPSDPASVF